MNRSLRDGAIEFVYHECELLDSGRFEEWLALFAPDGLYWVPLAHNQVDPQQDFSLVHEEPLLLRMRVERMMHPAAHGMDIPIRTSRVIGNVRLTTIDDKRAEATARFCLVEAENDRQRIFAGKYSYVLQHHGDWSIKQKRVDLVNCDAPFASIQVIL